MAKRTKADANQTREDLIQAATKLFEANGYANTSINDICGEVGITKGALFHHFTSKQDVFLEIWTRLQVAMDQEAREAAISARNPDDPYSAFLAGCKVYLNHVIRPAFQKIVLIDGPAVLGMRDWQEIDHDLGHQNVHAGVSYFAKKGIVAEHRVAALAVMIQSALNGAGFALVRKEKGITVDSVYDAFEVMVKSLR